MLRAMKLLLITAIAILGGLQVQALTSEQEKCALEHCWKHWGSNHVEQYAEPRECELQKCGIPYDEALT